jgi:hypothetical protein
MNALEQLKALEQELANLKSQQAQRSPVRSSKIKRTEGTTYIPMSMTGQTLKARDQYTEIEWLEFKQKNLLKRAKELRDTAAWNLQEAERHEAAAKEVHEEIETLKLL